MVDKIIYSKALGKNIVNVVLNYTTNMLHIVVSFPIGKGEFVDKNIGSPFKIEDEDKAIKLVNNIHNKWLSIYKNMVRKAHTDLKENLKSVAFTSLKTLCRN